MRLFLHKGRETHRPPTSPRRGHLSSQLSGWSGAGPGERALPAVEPGAPPGVTGPRREVGCLDRRASTESAPQTRTRRYTPGLPSLRIELGRVGWFLKYGLSYEV